MPEYEIAPLDSANIAHVVEVIGRSRKENPFERAPTVGELAADTLMDGEFRPEGSWVVKVDGVHVAFAMASVEKNRISAGLDDARYEFDIVQEVRGRGLEQSLLRLACDYASARGVGKLTVRCIEEEKWRKAFLEAEGFVEAHKVFFLARPGREDVASVPVPEGIRLLRRPFKDCGDEEMARIVEAFNDSFQDHYNFAPERLERFTQYRDASEDPEMFSLAMSGDEIVGVCLSHEDRIYNLANGTRWGWINILGVRPPHRRNGVGRFLLADGMKWVLEQGMDTTYIGVYAKNEKALGMYLSMGFVKDRESTWFERVLR